MICTEYTDEVREALLQAVLTTTEANNQPTKEQRCQRNLGNSCVSVQDTKKRIKKNGIYETDSSAVVHVHKNRLLVRVVCNPPAGVGLKKVHEGADGISCAIVQ